MLCAGGFLTGELLAVLLRVANAMVRDRSRDREVEQPDRA